MAKNVTINIGNEQQSFQAAEIVRLQQVGSTGLASFVDGDVVAPIVLRYDDTGAYNEQNKLNIDLIKAAITAGTAVNVQIAEGDVYLPASVDMDDATFFARAIYFNATTSLEISMTTAGHLRYEYEPLVADAFNENELIPSTQKATADWLKAYVDTSIVNGEW